MEGREEMEMVSLSEDKEKEKEKEKENERRSIGESTYSWHINNPFCMEVLNRMIVVVVVVVVVVVGIKAF